MFKRILVLALFLFGVFWWFGQKDGSIEKGELVDKIQTEVKEKTEDAKKETSKEVKVEKVEASEEVKILETKKGEDEVVLKKEEVKIETEIKAVVQKTIQVPVSKKVYTAPKSTWKAPVITKKIIEEIISDRQVNIKTYMYEWNIDFSQKSFQSGTINFQVKNNGRFSHEFGIETLGSIGKVMPGEAKTFTVKLLPGTYEVFSKRRNDYEKGMKDVITVTK